MKQSEIKTGDIIVSLKDVPDGRYKGDILIASPETCKGSILYGNGRYSTTNIDTFRHATEDEIRHFLQLQSKTYEIY